MFNPRSWHYFFSISSLSRLRNAHASTTILQTLRLIAIHSQSSSHLRSHVHPRAVSRTCYIYISKASLLHYV